MPKSMPAFTLEDTEPIAEDIGYHVVIRPAYNMGGTGGGLVDTVNELCTVAARALSASLVTQILIE